LSGAGPKQPLEGRPDWIALFEHAPCGLLVTEPDGRILTVNATFLGMTGYDRPALEGGRRFDELLTPGGRISISDIVAADLPEAIRKSRDAWTGCLAGAISETDYVRGLKQAGLRDVRVTSRIVYDAGQLQGLFASSCCGIDSKAGHDADGLAAVAAGKIWSARFEGVKPHPGSVISETVIEPAVREDLPRIQPS